LDFGEKWLEKVKLRQGGGWARMDWNGLKWYGLRTRMNWWPRLCRLRTARCLAMLSYHWMYQSHAGIMGTGKPMYLFIPKGLNHYQPTGRW